MQFLAQIDASQVLYSKIEVAYQKEQFFDTPIFSGVSCEQKNNFKALGLGSITTIGGHAT